MKHPVATNHSILVMLRIQELLTEVYLAGQGNCKIFAGSIALAEACGLRVLLVFKSVRLFVTKASHTTEIATRRNKNITKRERERQTDREKEYI